MVRLSASQGRQRALLFDLGAVMREMLSEDGGWCIELTMVERDFLRFIKRENLSPDILESLPPKEAALSAI
jgi:hypothetical protein